MVCTWTASTFTDSVPEALGVVRRPGNDGASRQDDRLRAERLRHQKSESDFPASPIRVDP